MAEITKETLDEIIKRIDENVHDIKIQTIKTNGRVTDIEKWKARVMGALIIMNLIIIPVLIKCIDDFIK